MKELFSLGEIYVSDFLKHHETPRNSKVEMKLMFDQQTKLVRLEKVVPTETMFGKYWYRSGINNSMKVELHSIVNSILSVYTLEKNDIWLDIACNDGTLLSFIPKTFFRMGIDPAEDSYKIESEKHADIIIQDFFDKKLVQDAVKPKEKVSIVTTIAMFYDLENPSRFLQDVYEILNDDGLFVCQMSYTPLMINQMAFDNICHEHLYYYTLFTIKNLFEKNGFKLVDCQLNDANGGSFRVYAMKDIGDVTKFATQPYRDVCNFRINSLLKYEEEMNFNTEAIWKEFYNNLLELKFKVHSFIKEEKIKGKTIWAYGASTKGNTLLQYFDLDSTLITGIAERSPYKFGLKTVGTNIPIYSEDEMRVADPDYLLVLPWHFINEFKIRESNYLANGGKFIVPCPKFEIISK